MNANFLLNIGPMPSGKIQPEFVSRLREIGQWLEHNGTTIYGTRGGPVPPQKWGVTTQAKDGQIYVHVLDPKLDRVTLPRTARFDPADYSARKSAGKLLTGEAVRIVGRTAQGELQLQLPDKRDPIDTIVVLPAVNK
jgi:alpha-L-fucosidase